MDCILPTSKKLSEGYTPPHLPFDCIPVGTEMRVNLDYDKMLDATITLDNSLKKCVTFKTSNGLKTYPLDELDYGYNRKVYVDCFGRNIYSITITKPVTVEQEKEIYNRKITELAKQNKDDISCYIELERRTSWI